MRLYVLSVLWVFISVIDKKGLKIPVLFCIYLVATNNVSVYIVSLIIVGCAAVVQCWFPVRISRYSTVVLLVEKCILYVHFSVQI